MGTTETLAIIGKSGHGKVIADIARDNGYTELLWVDDDASLEHVISINTFIATHASLPVIVAVGDNPTRQKIHHRLHDHGFSFATLIHSSAIISPTASIGAGSVVMPLAVINADTTVGEGCIINTHATIEHDVTLGSFVHISPNAALSGGVQVGMCSHIGTGVSTIQLCRVGSDSIIGAGSTIIDDIPDNSVAAGSPAKVIRANR
jgi:UDP-N-acetylbacillosamine N-acetyltransferase